MWKSKFGKTFIASIVIGTTIFGYVGHHDEAQAVGNYYYDGLHAGEYSGYLKAKKISNSSISNKYYPNASQSNLKSIGRVSNLNGWKVGIPEYKGQDSMGTGTVMVRIPLSQMDMLLMINMVKLQHQNILNFN